MLALMQLQFERCLASSADKKQANPVLRHAKIGAIDDMRRDHVAECCHRLRPCGVQSPGRELFNILDQHHFRTVEFGSRHNGPGR